MSILTVEDPASGRTVDFADTAEGWKAAFYDFAEPEDLRKMSAMLESGEYVSSWSGKSHQLNSRETEALGFWRHCCSLIETDNQIWSVA